MIARIFYFCMTAICLICWTLNPASLTYEVAAFAFLIMLRLEDIVDIVTNKVK